MKPTEVTHAGATGLIRDQMVASLDEMLDHFARKWRTEGFTLPEIDQAIADARQRFVADIDSRLLGKVLSAIAASADDVVKH